MNAVEVKNMDVMDVVKVKNVGVVDTVKVENMSVIDVKKVLSLILIAAAGLTILHTLLYVVAPVLIVSGVVYFMYKFSHKNSRDKENEINVNLMGV